MAEQTHFLATPKGVFVMGIIVGAIGVLSIGFVMAASGQISFGHERQGVEATAPTDDAAANMQAPSPSAIPPAATGLKGMPRAVSKTDHVLGTGPVTIIEYADYQCPFCQQFHKVMQDVMAKNQGKVRWVFRHFPLTSIHPNADTAANAAECASDQGKFWEMTDTIYTHQAEGLSVAQLTAYATEAGVKDSKAFSACLAAKPHEDVIAADAQDAEAIGGDGTPYSVVINGKGNAQEIPGALPASNVQAIIDALSK